jgi:macrolide-specific efflux system membrane fusion protein
MVDEVDIAGVRTGNLASFTVEAYPSIDFSGVVARVNPTATIVSGVVNYEVVIALRDETGLLKPDMTANVSLRTGEREALVLPDAAIHGEGEGKFVYVLENAQPRRRAVTLGAREAAFTEIKRGLSGQEQVFVGAVAVPNTEAIP